MHNSRVNIDIICTLIAFSATYFKYIFKLKLILIIKSIQSRYINLLVAFFGGSFKLANTPCICQFKMGSNFIIFFRTVALLALKLEQYNAW